jgi:hypothetical protein
MKQKIAIAWFLRLVLCATYVTVASEIPDSLEGRWVVKSLVVNEAGDEGGLTYFKKGSLWKLHADGTANCEDWNAKWAYDKKKQTFDLKVNSVVGYQSVISNGDVTQDGKTLIIKFTLYGEKKTLKLEPERK